MLLVSGTILCAKPEVVLRHKLNSVVERSGLSRLRQRSSGHRQACSERATWADVAEACELHSMCLCFGVAARPSLCVSNRVDIHTCSAPTTLTACQSTQLWYARCVSMQHTFWCEAFRVEVSEASWVGGRQCFRFGQLVLFPTKCARSVSSSRPAPFSAPAQVFIAVIANKCFSWQIPPRDYVSEGIGTCAHMSLLTRAPHITDQWRE